ncbi:CRAL/TRIO domain-containing protein [Pseudovirgaria hyperparasitica]|uniref:Phosphatidylinositol transfer protein SFH5 n=1 Tax=Pseudovirgaria hyperparasitica TaxID=470096 RepID=A0A6A6WGM7_9PEZI|nr:CRAL/TRIO domain-containing protein [Pseudovirgaria hyperparasitica]KAF2761369.1 CRAL/TRIO domain-containing protein [Pseudovirgaria hyperparasitica]
MADAKPTEVVPLTSPDATNKPDEAPQKTEPSGGAVLPLTQEPEEAPVEQKTEGAVNALPLTSSEATKEPEGEPTKVEPGAALPLTSGAADSHDGWPTLTAEHPLSKFVVELPTLVKEADYNEVWGVHLASDNSFQTKLILQKFLRANQNDLSKAKDQLLKTLKWRKEFQPLKTIEEVFDKSKFGGLGYILDLSDVPEDGKAVVTFNLYGAVKDNKKTFGVLDEFIRWRVSLMELSLQKLSLSTATTPIPDWNTGRDPYQAYQVHDYMSVSFLRQDPLVKAAVKATVDTFSAYYPETLSRKFFINVPAVMGWMFTAAKMLLSKETVRKFTVLSSGSTLVSELGPDVPEQYGGKGKSLEEAGTGPKMDDKTEVAVTTE